MKATGIVRRIDDLGRVVIPKEIRRTQHIRQGTPLEIFTTADGEVIFKKYSPVEELDAFAQRYVQVLARTLGATALICDRDHVLAAAGSGKKDLQGGHISPQLEQLMEQRSLYRWQGRADKPLPICRDAPGSIGVAAPILAAGDVVGAVVAVQTEAAPGADQTMAVQVAAGFLARQLEE